MHTYKKDNFTVLVKAWMDKEQYELGDKMDRDSMMDQVEHVAQLPFAFHHVALMPDGHVGYGMPIGGVFASKGYISPNMVGVDIGCGMGYIQTNVPVKSFELVQTKDGQNLIWAMLSNITRNIPVGFNHHKTPQETWLPDHDVFGNLPIITQEYESSLMQLGTLGGGK
jgi:tRNA-splicing ligase RtcB